jgi:hypothetical protein
MNNSPYFVAREEATEGLADFDATISGSLSVWLSEGLLGRVIGRSLRIEEISPDEARRELLTIGLAMAVNMLLQAWAAAIGQPAYNTRTSGPCRPPGTLIE